MKVQQAKRLAGEVRQAIAHAKEAKRLIVAGLKPGALSYEALVPFANRVGVRLSALAVVVTLANESDCALAMGILRAWNRNMKEMRDAAKNVGAKPGSMPKPVVKQRARR
jgi:hypothetical protein